MTSDWKTMTPRLDSIEETNPSKLFHVQPISKLVPEVPRAKVPQVPGVEVPDPVSDATDIADKVVASDCKTRLTFCKTTAIFLLKRFAGDSSAHGLSHLISSSRGLVSKCLWAVTLTAALAGLMYSQASLLIDLSNFPVKTVNKIEVKEALVFPGVTLCNINDIDTDKVPFNGPAFLSYTQHVMWNTTFAYSNTPLADSMLNTSINSVVNCSWIDFGDFFVLCSVSGEAFNCSDLFTFTQTSRARCAVLNTNHPSLRYMSFAGPLSGLRVYLNVHQDGYSSGHSDAAGVKMFIHEPGYKADMHNTGLLLSPGLSNYVGLTPVRFSFLSAPYKAFGDDECVDTKDEEHSRRLRLTDKYTYNACTLECALDLVASTCGCNGVENDMATSSLPYCTVQQFYECYDKILRLLSEDTYRRPYRVYYNVSASNPCDCDRPCEFTSYSPQISTAYFPSTVTETMLKQNGILPLTTLSPLLRQNYLELRVYLNDIIDETRKHEAVYTFTNVIGSIGGQMGMFLGASILTVVELIELGVFFILRCMMRITCVHKLACLADCSAIQPNPPGSTS